MESGLKTLSPSSSEELGKRKSPWRLPANPQQGTCSLAAVMDEELAKKLQSEEDAALSKVEVEGPLAPLLRDTGPAPEDNTQDDYLMAQMLQLEYDKEHDLRLQAEEKHFNKHSTVHVSFEKFRSVHPYLEEEGEQSDDESYDDGDFPILDRPSKGHRRSKGVPKGTPTKHDAEICGRKNVRTMEKFPPDFPAGDLNEKGQDYRLSNSVFNSLKQHSQKEEKYAQRLHEKKEHSTHEQVLDQKTRLMLFKIVDSGLLTEMNGCISTGKEARIYHAQGGQSEDIVVPPECAVKIFKTTLNEFKNRDRYIKGDHRFKDRFGKVNPRKLVKLWAEKEMRNLKRLSAKGVLCPEVLLLKKHVLVMSFIGEDMHPAPQLREARLSGSQLESAYHQCIKGMKKMYTDCHLVHADLSEYNMLWHKGNIYFIDVGQSVEPFHPNGLEFLYRDCLNVSGFFSRAGMGDEAKTPQDLFNYITGIGVHADTDQEFIVQLKNHRQREKLEMGIHSKSDYPFDYFFEKTTTGTTLLPKKEPGHHSDSQQESAVGGASSGHSASAPGGGSELDTASTVQQHSELLADSSSSTDSE